jgi:hypothetical protein
MDPLIDEQVSQMGADELSPDRRPEDRPWREAEVLIPEEAADEAWQEQEQEATGTAGGGMPEAAGQAVNPGTDTDVPVPPAQKRINLDRT